MTTLTEKQIQAIDSMSDQVRFDHLIKSMTEIGQVWTLANSSGCLLIDTGEEQCLLLFSHEQLAQLWAEQEHSEYQPLQIELTKFTEKWLPGMANDGFFIACQPNLAGEAFIESPADFAENFN
ncbi:DUF2750 domain-containing protein [Thalassotalea mangrovi]|uniref:DUF2750 domain-containing protein n=1 Tax=Thalassotalea mangrovi TaxID=2572245 RepID=A0A4U1B327_9GAMM|nr:DUF2750 domain-containing protein [Thalassotalea mangrovi]TKB44215.1 DUF2750 domain-containing protein [Thalassotalea mangrovi]